MLETANQVPATVYPRCARDDHSTPATGSLCALAAAGSVIVQLGCDAVTASTDDMQTTLHSVFTSGEENTAFAVSDAFKVLGGQIDGGLWTLDLAACPGSQPSHRQFIGQSAVSSVLCADSDQSQYWVCSADAGVELVDLRQHEASVASIVAPTANCLSTHNKSQLVVGSLSGQVRLYDTRRLDLALTQASLNTPVSAVAAGPSWHYAASASDSFLNQQVFRFSNSEHDGPVQRYELPGLDEVVGLAAAADGILVCGDSGNGAGVLYMYGINPACGAR